MVKLKCQWVETVQITYDMGTPHNKLWFQKTNKDRNVTKTDDDMAIKQDKRESKNKE